MTPARWPCPGPAGTTSEEYALVCGERHAQRLVIVPALFGEGNRLRRLAVGLMRRLGAAGIGSVLPDLPGSNESLAPLEQQTPGAWLEAMSAAAEHFGATHALGMRGGCLFVPPHLPGWHYAPVAAAALLRQLMRAQALAAREAGRAETSADIAEAARSQGFELAGYPLSAQFYREFEPLLPSAIAAAIVQEDLGGSALWLRSEPDDDPDQADALAAIVARGLGR